MEKDMKIVRRVKQAFLDAEEKQKKLLSGAAIGGTIGIMGMSAADLMNYQGHSQSGRAAAAAEEEPITVKLQRDLPISGPLKFSKR
jgi:hypothetical protein